jgi:hypothetical protein
MLCLVISYFKKVGHFSKIFFHTRFQERLLSGAVFCEIGRRLGVEPQKRTPVMIAGKGKGKGVPMLLTEHHAMKAYWKSGSIAPRIL